MMIFTQTENGNYLRIIKNPKGPTLTFKIEEYSLAKDVIKHQQKQRKQSKIFSTLLQAAPLLIMNGFKAEEDDTNDVKNIVSLMLQSLFPPIKVNQMNMSACKRVCLFDRKENGDIDFRHFGVSARQRAINRGIKRLVNKNRQPDLSRFSSIADYVMKKQRDSGAYSSESEIDDLPGSKITLPDDYQDKKKNTQVAIRLSELGPRVKLHLLKIEEGLCRGNVIFHAHQNKTPG